jgi:hypothetical protein
MYKGTTTKSAPKLVPEYASMKAMFFYEGAYIMKKHFKTGNKEQKKVGGGRK